METLASANPGGYNWKPMRRWWIWPCLVAMAAALGGCDSVAPIFRPTTGGWAGADISPKNTWTATGTVSNPQLAVDNDLSTAARSDYRQGDAELTIDLKRMCLFQTVIIEHGSERDSHARNVTVATSPDGKNFVDRHTVPGVRRVTVVSLPAPVLARYVRLKADNSGLRPWNVAEVYLQ
jgi:hypothetical protein